MDHVESWDMMEGFIVGQRLLSDVTAPKRAIFSDLQCNVGSTSDEAGRGRINTWLQRLQPPPQLELPCAKHDRCILHTSPA